MINLISVGRLSKEKGTDLLIELLPQLVEQFGSTFSFHFFGDGPLREEVAQLANIYEHIFCHGHIPKEQVFTVWKDCHYTVMPSTFLETFGLTALDSLSLGVPVICGNKGGLVQFIVDETLILSSNNSLKSILSRSIAGFDLTTWQQLSGKASSLYMKYSWDQWYSSFQQYSGLQPGTRIALVSDYGVDIGGIENWLLLLQEKLRTAGYKVKLIGGINHKPSRWRKMTGLLTTAGNLLGGFRLRRELTNFVPDLVWYHSVHRVFGPLPLWMSSGIQAKKRIMYHDFGLFHPYPSKVYNDNQVVRAKSFLGYISEGWRSTPIAFFLHIAKYCQKIVLIKTLRSLVDKHFVPSSYMEGLITKHGIPQEKLFTLPHFIQPMHQGEQ